jgi:hypothetical protein
MLLIEQFVDFGFIADRAPKHKSLLRSLRKKKEKKKMQRDLLTLQQSDR